MDLPELTLSSAATEHAVLTEATMPAAVDGEPPIIAGFLLHTSHAPRAPYRVLTANGSLYGVHLDRDIALDDLRHYAAQLLTRGDDRK